MSENDYNGAVDDVAAGLPWPGRAATVKVAPLSRVRSALLRIGPQVSAETKTMTKPQAEVGAAGTVEAASVAAPAQRLASRITDPAQLCALLLLRRALRAVRPDQSSPRSAQMVVIEVPDAGWTKPAAWAWRWLAAADTAPTEIEDRDVTNGQWPYGRRPDWVLIARSGTDKRHTPDNGNTVITLAACDGVAVLGVSPDPARCLPRALVQAADLRLTLPGPRPADLRQVGRTLTGRSPRTAVGVDWTPGVSPDLLRLARRSGQTADEWLLRLEQLVAANVPAPPAITLGQLAGMDEVVAWGEALARDLADYKAGRIGWDAVDRGVLMAGAPGVGKTTAAKAIAGTCAVPLIATSYAAWQAHNEGHLGHLIQAMRAVFRQARAAAPCVLFIDELDSLQRRGRHPRWDDWWTAIINGLLEQLDGLAGRDGVVVIAATNHPDHIDPAILRAGRLDRVIHIPLPDCAALVGILRHHLRGDLASLDLSPFAERLARRAMTGADAEKLVRGARRRARQAGRPMRVDDLTAELGEDAAVPPDLRRRQAVHEAGHAVVANLLAPGSLERVSIRGHGDVGGWTRLRKPLEAITRERVISRLSILLAGRAAEAILLGAPSAGAGGAADSDLGRATWLAASAVTTWGLGRDPAALLWRLLSDEHALALLPQPVQTEITDLLADADVDAQTIIRTHRVAVEVLAERLLDTGEVSGPEAETLLEQAASRSAEGTAT